VAVVRADVSEERIASVIKVKRIIELRTLAVTSNRCTLMLLVTAKVLSSPILFTLMMEAIRAFQTSVHKRAMRRHIPEDGMFHSHRLENFKSYSELLFVIFLVVGTLLPSTVRCTSLSELGNAVHHRLRPSVLLHKYLLRCVSKAVRSFNRALGGGVWTASRSDRANSDIH
jgi:hypothetical protein